MYMYYKLTCLFLSTKKKSDCCRVKYHGALKRTKQKQLGTYDMKLNAAFLIYPGT